MLGPQDDRFTERGIAAFLGAPTRCCRRAIAWARDCEGPPSSTRAATTSSPTAFALGGIQVVGDGQPIVLLVDRQSTGGYTKIATVCSFDIGRVGQIKPGQRLSFRQLSVAAAHAWLRAHWGELEQAVEFGQVE